MPQVSVIVPTHLDENKAYLDLCLDALSQSTGMDYEVLVVSSAKTPPIVPQGMRSFHRPDLDTAVAKTHFATGMSDPQSKYFLFLSDDVVVSRGMLSGLVSACADKPYIMIPMSNGDNGGQFEAKVLLRREIDDEGGSCRSIRELPCNLSIEDLGDWKQKVIDRPSGNMLLVPRDYVCFFCVLIPRAVWEKIGPLDERFENRYTDTDYCWRLRNFGGTPVINFGEFALHFGSRTLNKIVTPEMFKAADIAFGEKWGKRPSGLS